jgi:hypothetical protein
MRIGLIIRAGMNRQSKALLPSNDISLLAHGIIGKERLLLSLRLRVLQAANLGSHVFTTSIDTKSGSDNEQRQ